MAAAMFGMFRVSTKFGGALHNAWAAPPCSPSACEKGRLLGVASRIVCAAAQAHKLRKGSSHKHSALNNSNPPPLAFLLIMSPESSHLNGEIEALAVTSMHWKGARKEAALVHESQGLRSTCRCQGRGCLANATAAQTCARSRDRSTLPAALRSCSCRRSTANRPPGGLQHAPRQMSASSSCVACSNSSRQMRCTPPRPRDSPPTGAPAAPTRPHWLRSAPPSPGKPPPARATAALRHVPNGCDARGRPAAATRRQERRSSCGRPQGSNSRAGSNNAGGGQLWGLAGQSKHGFDQRWGLFGQCGAGCVSWAGFSTGLGPVATLRGACGGGPTEGRRGRGGPAARGGCEPVGRLDKLRCGTFPDSLQGHVACSRMHLE